MPAWETMQVGLESGLQLHAGLELLTGLMKFVAAGLGSDAAVAVT